MPSSSRHDVQGGTTGSFPKPDGESPPPVLDQQPTVISNRAPLSVPPTPEPLPSTGSDRAFPTRLGHFELTEYVGGGGMGRVFRGYDTVLARPVAVKVLSREQAADAEIVARFRNEAQSAARLNHDNIVQVFHVGDEDGLPYIVFEFIEGCNLRDLVEQKGGLPLAEAISYTFQIARALAHAAACNVVHRDIKPSNVLIAKDGRVKLIDMGLARLQRSPSSDGDLTASGVTLGTFDYISPEQARDPRTADARSDIYSLGCTLFYMLTGRPPFPEGTVLQKLLQHQGEKPPDVRQSRPDSPEEVSQLLRRMMAKDPRRRFQTPAELIDGLVLLAEQVGLAPARLGPPGWVVPRHSKLRFLQRHVPWLAPLALLVGMVLTMQWVGSPRGDSGNAAAFLVGGPEEPAAAVPEPKDSRGAEKGRAGPVSRPPDTPLPPDSSDKIGPASGSAAEPGAESGPKEVQPAAKKTPGLPAGEAIPPRAAALEKGSGSPGVASSKAPAKVPATTVSGANLLRPGGTEGGLSLSDPAAWGLLTLSQSRADRAELAVAAVSPIPAAPPLAPAAKVAVKGPAEGVLIVDGTGASPNRFATLEAACRAATNNDVIELRYNGPREEKPIALGNLRLTIRAGRGFQPVVAFRPGTMDPVEYPRSMFTLTGTHLALVEVPLELAIPREVQADGWSLLEIRQAEMTRLEKCTLTIRNASQDQGAYHEDVAFFRVKAPPGTDVAREPRVESEESRRKGLALDSSLSTLDFPAMAISLSDCVVRGEAVVLRVQHPRPLQFTWNDGLLATSEWLLVADASQQALPPGESLKIDLQHLTAVARSGVCQFVQNDSAPHRLTAQLSVSNSILMGAPAAPLIQQTGVSASDAYQRRVVWNGDRNFYEGFTVFWSVEFANPDTPPERMGFDQWQRHWGPEEEIHPVANRVQWKRLPAADRPLHTCAPADYALSAASLAGPNPAVGAANDGRDAGAQMDRLPEVPPLSPEPLASSSSGK